LQRAGVPLTSPPSSSLPAHPATEASQTAAQGAGGNAGAAVTTLPSAPHKFKGGMLWGRHGGKPGRAAGGVTAREALSSGHLIAGSGFSGGGSSQAGSSMQQGAAGGVGGGGGAGHGGSFAGHGYGGAGSKKGKGWRGVVQDSAEALNSLWRGRRRG
jgi:hypothetical protein